MQLNPINISSVDISFICFPYSAESLYRALQMMSCEKYYAYIGVF